MEYIAEGERADSSCPFCVDRATAAALPGLIVHAGSLAYVTLNLYPYNNGHLLILPYGHVADLTDLKHGESVELMSLLIESRRVLQTALRPEGFNIGMNIGGSAGAGIPEHLHFHVVPRWGGDTNFMPVVGDTKVLPESLEATKARIVEAWATATPEGESE